MFDDPVMKPVFGLQTFDSTGKPTVPPMAMTMTAHNVFSKEELLRLNSHHAGDFEIDGAFLVNPVTKFAIQPTRGFGDFDMFGTGYTDEPEVSSAFVLEEGVLVFAASDGVFDEHVWKDEELVTFFDHQLCAARAAGKPVSANEIASKVYQETLDRSLAGGYVDDISLYCFMAPAPLVDAVPPAPPSPVSAAQPALQPTAEPRKKSLVKDTSKRKSLMKGLWDKVGTRNAKLERSGSLLAEFHEDPNISTAPQVEKAAPEDRRRTIDRKDVGSFTELTDMFKRAQEEQPADTDTEKLAQVVLGRFANRYGHDPSQVNVGRGVAGQAAAEGQRMSKRL
jgi:hypothetical protein